MRRLLMLAAAALLIAPPLAAAQDRGPDWGAWQLLMWQDRTPAQLQGLKALGFTGGKLRGTGGVIDTDYQAKLLQAGLRPYLENVATDFYAAYHRYTAGKPVNWAYEAARARYRADPADPAAFVREPSLSDPAWLDRIAARLAAVVHAEAPIHPLFYNLADESGIADLAANWDFDRSVPSLDGFRTWLQGEYPSLDALNAEWGTAFAAWGDVRPMSTQAALQATDGNLAAWSDFKAWMDVAFARAVRRGTDAVHAADPQALSALEGGQIPGWGGYDYALLAPAVDVMEIYDVGDALDLAAGFHPGLRSLRTTFGTGPRETFAAWHSLLHGGRGEVVWDEADDVVGADGQAGPRGLELAALSKAVAPAAAALHNAQPMTDPVAVLVSQASFRVRWMLDRQAGDHDWAARDAEREYDDNAWRASRRSVLQLLAGLGVQPRFVAGLGDGALTGVKLLLLPHAIALPDADVAAIRAFRAAGGTVLADTEPGLFDGHGRRRATPPLPDLPIPVVLRPSGYPPGPDALEAMDRLLQQAGMAPRARFVGPDGQRAAGLDVRWMRGASGPVLALQAASPWGGPPRLTVRLAHPQPARDVRTGKDLGTTDRLDVALDPIEPTVLALTPPP